jgi:putative CocE/NonD family hydrolase
MSDVRRWSIAATACASNAACAAACPTASSWFPITTIPPSPAATHAADAPALRARHRLHRRVRASGWFARHGYNVVIQDVRGRGDSEGEFYPFRNEGARRRGDHRVAAHAPESNGRVGMYGFSYQGMTQLLAAAEQPEGLQCIAPGMTACDLYHGWFYHHGRAAPGVHARLGIADAEGRRAPEAKCAKRATASNKPGPISRRKPACCPFARIPRCTAKGLPQYVLDWFDHDEPGEYWSSLDVSRRLDKPHRSGAAHLRLVRHVSQAAASMAFSRSADRRAANSRASTNTCSPGPGFTFPGATASAARFRPEALLDTDAILLRWFNHWLKDSGSLREPRIRHFVLGENRWREAESFPASRKTLFSCTARAKQIRAKAMAFFRCKPIRGGTLRHLRLRSRSAGPRARRAGRRERAVRSGRIGTGQIMCSSTPPSRSRQPLWSFGIPARRLYCATSAGAHRLHRKAVRVRPNGAAEFICIGIARSSWLFREKVTPRTNSLLGFFLEPTSCRFDAGDRIRLEIASSAFPLYDRNPGSGVPSCRATSWDWRRSTQIVYHDGNERPSALYLPMSEEPDERRIASAFRNRIAASPSATGQPAAARFWKPSTWLSPRANSSASSAHPAAEIDDAEVDLRAGDAERGTIRVDGMTPKNARETFLTFFRTRRCCPGARAQNVGLGLELEGVAKDRRRKGNCGTARTRGAEACCQGLSARIFGRDEDARFDRARAGHESAAAC